MLTQCPACETTFRVTAEQLRVKGGRVRCGECQHAFNALDKLIDALPDNIHSPAPKETGTPDPLAEPLQHLPDETITDLTDSLASDRTGDTVSTEIEASEKAPHENFSDHFYDVGTPSEAPSLPESLTEFWADSPDDTEAKKSLESSAVESSAHHPPEPTNILLDGPFAEIPNPTPTRRWPWIVGSLLLLVMLGGQAVLAFHAPLAKSLPAVQPAIAAMCRLVHCTIRLPAQRDLISIESSDLHPDPTTAGRLVVSAILKNRAAFQQQFPHLELTLTDIADKAILRKVLPPTTYLPADTLPANGMPPNADIAVNLVITTDSLTANGYRLYLFYP